MGRHIGRRLRVTVEKPVEKAGQGDQQAIREVIDRLDGKPAQAIERGEAQSLFGFIRPQIASRLSNEFN